MRIVIKSGLVNRRGMSTMLGEIGQRFDPLSFLASQVFARR